MKAILWTAYGTPDVLRPGQVETPVPKEGEVLIKIHAANVSAGDCEMRRLKFPLLYRLPIRLMAGVVRPTRFRILGQELAGEIEAVGRGVTRFKAGDAVFASTGFSFGAYAEYTCLPETGIIAKKPETLSFAEAAALPVGGCEALYFFRKGSIRSEQKVLINGAGGSIGTLLVQLAKNAGAEVTAVDSREKLEMLLSIGADHGVDYTREDFTQSGKKYDLILDIAGKSPFSGSVRSLKLEGSYLLNFSNFLTLLRGAWISKTSNRKVVFGSAVYTVEDLVFLKEMIEAGKIRPVIDRSFPLSLAAEAHRYVEAGHKKGNVVLQIQPDR